MITDRLAIVDLINGYFAATDAKDWDAVADFYTDDAPWWNPQDSTTGRAEIVGFTRAMLGTDEIVTYHHVASFTPVIDGDVADAPVRVRDAPRRGQPHRTVLGEPRDPEHAPGEDAAGAAAATSGRLWSGSAAWTCSRDCGRSPEPAGRAPRQGAANCGTPSAMTSSGMSNTVGGGAV